MRGLHASPYYSSKLVGFLPDEIPPMPGGVYENMSVVFPHEIESLMNDIQDRGEQLPRSKIVHSPLVRIAAQPGSCVSPHAQAKRAAPDHEDDDGRGDSRQQAPSKRWSRFSLSSDGHDPP